jgi:hypothetical protein
VLLLTVLDSKTQLGNGFLVSVWQLLCIAMVLESVDNARLLGGDLAGPLALTTCEPRQARKGATVAVSYVPGCGWLGCLHSVISSDPFDFVRVYFIAPSL